MRPKDRGLLLVSGIAESPAQRLQLPLRPFPGGEIVGVFPVRGVCRLPGDLRHEPLVQVHLTNDHTGRYRCSCITHIFYLPGIQPFESAGSATSRMQSRTPWSTWDATTMSAACKTAGSAFATATPSPAQQSISISFILSPIAMVCA